MKEVGREIAHLNRGFAVGAFDFRASASLPPPGKMRSHPCFPAALGSHRGLHSNPDPLTRTTARPAVGDWVKRLD